MIYITGDIHGECCRVSDMVRYHHITPEDTIVLLGDVAMNYYGAELGDRSRKANLEKLGIPILCIHGNHEMRPETVATYRETPWRGGIVYAEADFPHLLFAKDGEVYDLEGRQCIALGGAYSVDKWYRLLRHWAWFEDEQPSDEIKARVKAKLDAIGWKVDAVFSHTCPYEYIPVEAFLPGIDQSSVDNSTEEWLEEIRKKLDHQAWYCGHWHMEKRIDKMHFLFETTEILDGD